MKTHTDCFGRKVRLTDERLNHILEHAEMRAGGNFQNFWFGPIKDADESLIKFLPDNVTPTPPITITPRSR